MVMREASLVEETTEHIVQISRNQLANPFAEEICRKDDRVHSLAGHTRL